MRALLPARAPAARQRSRPAPRSRAAAQTQARGAQPVLAEARRTAAAAFRGVNLAAALAGSAVEVDEPDVDEPAQAVAPRALSRGRNIAAESRERKLAAKEKDPSLHFRTVFISDVHLVRS
jgi:hypothetical protein